MRMMQAACDRFPIDAPVTMSLSSEIQEALSLVSQSAWAGSRSVEPPAADGGPGHLRATMLPPCRIRGLAGLSKGSRPEMVIVRICLQGVLDHRHDAGADGLGQRQPGGHDLPQGRVGTSVLDQIRRKRISMWRKRLGFAGIRRYRTGLENRCRCCALRCDRPKRRRVDLRASVGSTAASADTFGAAIIAVFYPRALPSTAEWFDFAGQPFHSGSEGLLSFRSR